MKIDKKVRYRNSDRKWVYEIDGSEKSTSFTLRYSSKFKLLAWAYCEISYKSDIAECLERGIELEKDL